MQSIRWPYSTVAGRYLVTGYLGSAAFSTALKVLCFCPPARPLARPLTYPPPGLVAGLILLFLQCTDLSDGRSVCMKVLSAQLYRNNVSFVFDSNQASQPVARMVVHAVIGDQE